MKRIFMLIPLALLCCPGCQQSGDIAAVDVEADIQAIKNIVELRNAAANASDLDRHMSYFADDAVVIRANEPAAIGKEAVRSRHQKMYDTYILQEKDVIENIEVSGDLAVAHVTWSGIYTPKDGGEPGK